MAQVKGIPDRGDYGSPTELTPGELVKYFIQSHDAHRSGSHQDIRLGGDRLLSFATKKGMPAPGQRHALFPQPVHAGSYGAWSGQISKGYGAGDVKSRVKGSALILEASPRHIRFVTAHTGEPESFNMVKIGPPGKEYWLTTNTTPTKPSEHKKIHYTKIPAERIDKLMDPKYVVSAKIDGAHALMEIMKDHVEVLSPRANKKGMPINYAHHMGLPARFEVPKALVGQTFRGEVYGKKPDDSIIPVQELGGILNSTIGKALDTKNKGSIRLQMALFGIGDEGAPHKEIRSKAQAAIAGLPKGFFTEPPYAYDKKEKQDMVEAIKAGKNKLTREGVVGALIGGGKPAKVKFGLPESDVIVKRVFKADTKSGAPRAGGFEYALPKDPAKVVGKIGSGFSHPTLVNMLAHPAEYVGRTARIKAQEQFPSGAFRAPSFIDLHQDISKKSAETTHA